MKIPKIKKLPSGNYFCQLRLHGQSISITAATEKECKRTAELIKAEYNAGKSPYMRKSANVTLAEAAEQYIELNAGRLGITTIEGYKKILRNQFPALFEMPLYKITDKALRDAVNAECLRTNQRGQRYSPKTICNGYGFIAEVLKYNDIEFTTPPLPEIKKKPVMILRPEQVYEAVKGTEIELPCLLSMWLSFTISEIRGFTKSKSIRNKQITVVETVVDINGKPVRKADAKEEERARTHMIPPYIQELINKVDGDVLCPLSSQAVNKRLKRRLEKFGYPPISFHKLRHISASVAATLRIPDQYAQERGGWKSDYVMKRVYQHTFTEERIAAEMRINALFENIIANKLLMEEQETRINTDDLGH